MKPASLPELVPARMLNEFVYCPRLFYLEWVEGLWDDNADTAEGSLAHRRSDRGGGRMPAPAAAADEPWSGAARSITLDAPILGMIATLDVVEAADGAVTAVDHKKGRSRSDGQAWEPDRVQVAAQALILRENGYRCDGGILSYRETRERIAVPVDDALAGQVRTMLDDLRATAASPHAPPPLVDSPKCPRCSLVGICLPDETNILREQRDGSARRLIATRTDAAPLYVQEQGSRVRLAGGRILVERDGETVASLRRMDVAEVALFGGAAISGPALRELASDGIPVTHFSFGGRFQAMTVGVEPRNIELRIQQFRHADDAGGSLSIARQIVAAKVRNGRVLVRRNGGEQVGDAVRELQRLARFAKRAPSAETLLGIEGAAAREYYRALATLIGSGGSDLPNTFDFTRRNRRPPRDRVNSVLSFLYAILTKECTVACRRVGFDPLLGFYHRPRFGRPALALDLMEEFRPLIADSTMLTLVNGRRLTPGDFEARGGAVLLSAAGRKVVIKGIEDRLATEVVHPTFKYKVTYRRAIELQTRVLAAHIMGELPAYQPFSTR